MDLQLTGKRALVTGSTQGIGYAIAKALAAEGADVVIHGRNATSVDAARAQLRAELPTAQVAGIAADLATAEGCASIAVRFPELDVLINNLGIYERCAFEDIADADWQRFFDVNVMSGVRLARAYLAGMKARNWGRVVFVSSESAIQIPANMIHYGMTKTAQLALARGLAETCAGTAVTVNAVLPGPTLTANLQARIGHAPGTPEFAAAEAAFFRDLRPSSLLRRFAAPGEVASLVAYVCSPLAAATNGAALRVDGGIVRACF